MNIILFCFLINITTPKESLRFQYCHEQGYDTSCGMSVVATVLDTYWNIPADELALVKEALGDKILAGDYTVTMADMGLVFSAKGIASKAYKMDWDGLVNLSSIGFAPVVLHYEKPEKHFALLLGFKDGRAITVDPARGLESLGKEEFLKRFSGAALVLASRTAVKNEAQLKEAIAYASGKQARMEETAYRIGKGF